MPQLRGEPAPSSLWSSYGTISPGVSNATSPELTGSQSASLNLDRSRGELGDVDNQSYPYGRYQQEVSGSYGANPPPPELHSQLDYQNNLKRSFSQTEPPPNPEMMHDLRDESPKVGTNHEHKLLAFRRAPDKHTITDQHGRVQQLDLSAHIHGMFFLSEMPASGGDGTPAQPELTCYRRNLFQISGSLVTPRGPMSVITETGERVPVRSMEMTVSAIESVDGNSVRLVVIPWKTPPPNSPDVNQAPDQEPPALPLIPFREDGTDAEGELAVYPVGWRRLQFRIATANNGRRKELQQHFVLHLKVQSTLANNSKVVLTESTTAPIVVRGRSPRNFQTRKEIPLLGSSAGSRGQALMETGLGVVAGPTGSKQYEVKPGDGMDVQAPRSSFTFSTPKPSGDEMSPVRSSAYPPWNSSAQSSLNQVTPARSGPYPTNSVGSDAYSKLPVPGGSSYSPETHGASVQTSMPPSVALGLMTEQHQDAMCTPYDYPASSGASQQMPSSASVPGVPDNGSLIPRYTDDGRSTKRNTGQQSVSSVSSIGAGDVATEYRYGGYGTVDGGPGDDLSTPYASGTTTQSTTAPRTLYPPPQSWRSIAGGSNTEAVMYGGSDARTYGRSSEQYRGPTGDLSRPLKAEPGQPGQPDAYAQGQRRSFDAVNNYSWGNT